MEHVVPNEMGEREEPLRDYEKESQIIVLVPVITSWSGLNTKLYVSELSDCLVWFLITVHAKQHYLFT